MLAIWLSPRQTIRSIVATDPTRGVLLVSWLAGFALFLDALMPKVQPKFPAGAVVLGALAAGPLVAFFLVFVEALLTAVAGRLLGGRAGALELRTALAWANAPLLWLLVLWPAQELVALPKLAVHVLGLAFFVWMEILAVVLVAEVQGFSIGRSLATILLAWLIKIAIIVGIVVASPGAERRSMPGVSASPAAAAIAP
jgi:hypothetical protein